MSSLESIRLDKWLWTARFFKTRKLAAEAVSGGKVHLNAELPSVLEQLQTAFDAQDVDSLREQIHRLLGGISYCNVDALRHAVIRCQHSIKTRSPDLAVDFQVMVDEIRKILETPSIEPD